MIRTAGPGDAAALLRLKQRLDRETSFMLIEADERDTSVQAVADGQGVGTGLLAEAKRWAASVGLHRLELTVMAHNHRAISLYERMGFDVEGRRSQCLAIDGRFVDELYMAVILDPA
jgi:ribosomal protein S18 acetylase RimI-like enzyme